MSTSNGGQVGQYAYNIMYCKRSLHGNANACSRLKLKFESVILPVPVELALLIQQLNNSALVENLIEREIENYLALTLSMILYLGWMAKNRGFTSFWLIQNELTEEGNIILRGSRVFVTMKFLEFVMEELHSNHQGYQQLNLQLVHMFGSLILIVTLKPKYKNVLCVKKMHQLFLLHKSLSSYQIILGKESILTIHVLQKVNGW